jgi:subtilisin-like proprotein convertase family protein
VPDLTTASSDLQINAPGRVKGVAVHIGSLQHSRTGDVKIELVSPGGTSVVLVNSRGDNGQDFTNTTFSDSATDSVAGASAPFTGTYRPEEPLSKLAGRIQQGTWKLRVTDQQGTHTGQLNSWGIDLSSAVCSGRPIATFTATPNPVLPGSAVQFDASESTDPDGTIAKYEWDLDGGTDFEVDGGTTPTLSHTFATRGNRAIRLRVTDDEGNQSISTVSLSVTQPPVAALDASPASPLTGDSVTLDAMDSVVPDGEAIARFEWDVDGDGNFERDTGTTGATLAQWATSGTKTVRVRVTDVDGATDVANLDVVVRNRPPSASFTGPSPAVVGRVATFSAAGSTDDDGQIVKHEWDLDGNGTYETDTAGIADVDHTFGASGSVTVGLRVTDDQGGTDTTTLVVTVTQAPVAAYTATANPTSLHRAVAFDASASSDPDGSIARYEWDLDGDGSFETDTGTTGSTSRVYDAGGTFDTKLRVTDDAGAQTVLDIPVVARNLAPTAALAVTPAPTTAGQAVTMDAGGSGDADGAVVRYDWDLDGNGSYETTTKTVPTHVHTYPNAGRFAIGVRVTDNDGGVATATRSLVVGTASHPAGSGGTTTPGGTGATNGGGAGGGSNPTAAFVASVTGTPLQRLSAVVSRGLRVGCRANRASTCRIRVELPRPGGRRVVVARATIVLHRSGVRSVRVRLVPAARRVLRTSSTATLLVRGTVRGQGASTRVFRAFLLRR